jgi:hypothetical protein
MNKNNIFMFLLFLNVSICLNQKNKKNDNNQIIKKVTNSIYKLQTTHNLNTRKLILQKILHMLKQTKNKENKEIYFSE